MDDLMPRGCPPGEDLDMGDERVGQIPAARAGTAGYTVTEAVTVVACMGVVAAFAAPNIIRFKSAMEVQNATAQVGGVLQQTRARAVSEAIPYLFLVQHEDVGDGSRGAFALIVRDNDRSYSVTPPDDVEPFSLDPSIGSNVRQFGESEAPSRTDIPPAYTDASTLRARDGSDPSTADSSGRGSSGSGSSGSGSSGGDSSGSGSGSGSSESGSGGLLGGVGEIVGGLLGRGGSGSSGQESSGSGSSGSGSAGSGSSQIASASMEEPSPTSLSDSVANGSTFPVSDSEGAPGVAFNERGIPVSLDSPGDWGSGAGAIYLTDDAGATYASVLSPLGEVSIVTYDSGSGRWR
jgi:type II secretory pathway pseudopilin PulG